MLRKTQKPVLLRLKWTTCNRRPNVNLFELDVVHSAAINSETIIFNKLQLIYLFAFKDLSLSHSFIRPVHVHCAYLVYSKESYFVALFGVYSHFYCNIEFHIWLSLPLYLCLFYSDFSIIITVAMCPICFLSFFSVVFVAIYCCFYWCRRFSYVILAASCDSCFPFLDQCFASSLLLRVRSFVHWTCFSISFVAFVVGIFIWHSDFYLLNEHVRLFIQDGVIFETMQMYAFWRKTNIN